MILFLNTTACPTSPMDTKKATIDSAILNLIQAASKSLKTSKTFSLKYRSSSSARRNMLSLSPFATALFRASTSCIIDALFITSKQ